MTNYLVSELEVSSMGRLSGSDAEMHAADGWLFGGDSVPVPKLCCMYF